MVGVEIPYALEHIHWPLFDHMVAKALRRGQCSQGLDDFFRIIERQYRWTHTSTEAFNAYYDLSHDFLSRNTNWFGWGASGWYEALLSGLAGIWEEPGGLAYVCTEQSQDIRLANLPYRGGSGISIFPVPDVILIALRLTIGRFPGSPKYRKNI